MRSAEKSRYWLPLLPLIVLLAFVYWLDQQVKNEIAATANSQRHAPDGIMENFKATTMNQQGRPRFILQAQQSRHYPDHDTTELDAPFLTLLGTEGPPVHCKGIKGNVSSRGEEIVFRGNVVVQREPVALQSAMTLHTEYLRVLPDQDLLTTPQAVTLFDVNNVVHAVGLEMDNKTRILKFLSQVRSEHHAK